MTARVKAQVSGDPVAASAETLATLLSTGPVRGQ
jgi:hypothetical protein